MAPLAILPTNPASDAPGRSKATATQQPRSHRTDLRAGALTSYRMTLLVEAEGLAPSVRSTGFQRSWSRLYQAGPFTVDMMFEPNRRSGRVFGQILHQDKQVSEGSVVLGDVSGEIACAEVGPDGDFAFEVSAAGSYRLHLVVDDAELMLEALDCS